jgi:hypothetical protein
MQKILDRLAEWLDHWLPEPEPEARPIPVRVDNRRRPRR